MNFVNSSLTNLREDVTEKCLLPIVFDLFTLVNISLISIIIKANGLDQNSDCKIRLIFDF